MMGVLFFPARLQVAAKTNRVASEVEPQGVAHDDGAFSSLLFKCILIIYDYDGHCDHHPDILFVPTVPADPAGTIVDRALGLPHI
jgi:hypothetical protein